MSAYDRALDQFTPSGSNSSSSCSSSSSSDDDEEEGNGASSRASIVATARERASCVTVASAASVSFGGATVMNQAEVAGGSDDTKTSRLYNDSVTSIDEKSSVSPIDVVPKLSVVSKMYDMDGDGQLGKQVI